MTKQEIINEADMLRGNINRMCITDNEKELADMYQWATKRAADLFLANLDRIHDEKKMD